MISLLIAALSILPMDRLAMADRLFNKGEYAAARREYEALKGEKSIPAEDLDYRLVNALKETGANKAEVSQAAENFLKNYPLSAYAVKIKLLRADSAEGELRIKLLKELDTDEIDAASRARALYQLAKATNDAALYLRSFKCDPKGVYAISARFGYARALAESGDEASLRDAMKELLEIGFADNGGTGEAALVMAVMISNRAGRYEETVSLAKRTLKKFPNCGEAEKLRLIAAAGEYSLGRYSAALDFCGTIKSEGASAIQALALERLGETEKALKAATDYLEQYPEGDHRQAVEMVLLRNRLQTAEAKADYHVALESARRMVTLTKSAEARLRYAWILEKSGDITAAEREYQAISVDFPKSATAGEALFMRAMSLLRKKEWSAAEVSLAEALDSLLEDSRKSEAQYWRGIALLHLEHHLEGARLLKEALKGHLSADETREARLKLAELDLQEGRVEAAKAAYQELINDGAAERMSASQLLTVGRMMEGPAALKCAEALIAGDVPEWRQAGYVLKGEISEKSGSLQKAIADYRSALKEKTETAEAALAALRLGKLEMRSGEFTTAEVTLKRAVELNRGDDSARAEAYLALAENALQLKDDNAAKGYATVVMSLFEDAALIERAKKIIDKVGEGTK